uniref:DUF4228 domain protein n=1 Tax=Zea mays TaxID=4577 RepID=A0A804RKB5_MAIZE
MGNFASCTLARTAGAGRASGSTVVLPDGRVRQVALPATAAELMLDAPGHFLADARALRPGRRIEALAADEGLVRGALYAVLPMKRPGRPRGARRRGAPGGRGGGQRGEGAGHEGRTRPVSSPAATAKVAAVFVAPPETLEAAALELQETDASKPRAPRLEEMAVDDAAAAAEIEELKQRLSGGGRRSRRPTLETIQEESYVPARC